MRLSVVDEIRLVQRLEGTLDDPFEAAEELGIDLQDGRDLPVVICEKCANWMDADAGGDDERICGDCQPEDPRDRADREGRTHS